MDFAYRSFCIVVTMSLLLWLCPSLETPTYAEQLVQAKFLQAEGYKELVREQRIADNRALAETIRTSDIVRWNDQLWLVVHPGTDTFGPMLHTFGSYRELFIQDDTSMEMLTEVIRWGSPGYTAALQTMTIEAVVRCKQQAPIGPLMM